MPLKPILDQIHAPLLYPDILQSKQSKQHDMRGIHLQQHDPITRAGGGVPLLQPAIKLGIGLAVLFVSFLAFAQSGRLYSHVVSLPEV